MTARRDGHGAQHVVGLVYLGGLAVDRGAPPGRIVDLAEHQQARRVGLHRHLDAMGRVRRDLHGGIAQRPQRLPDGLLQDRVLAGFEPGLVQRFEDGILPGDDLHAVHQKGPRQGGVVPVEVSAVGLGHG